MQVPEITPSIPKIKSKTVSESVQENVLSVSIVIPVYNSAQILPNLVKKVSAAMCDIRLEDDFEIILVNDASPDDSWLIICQLAKQHNFIKGICLRRNFGQHNATMAGLNHANSKRVIIMDDDLQHSPEYIGLLLEQLESGFDVCYTRYINRKHELWKRVGSRFNDWAATFLIDKPKGLYLSSFKALDAGVVKEIIGYDGPYPYIDGLILDVTRSINSIDIEHMARPHGKGNYNLKRSLSLWMKMATSFSVLPLRATMFFGFVLSLLSLLFITVIIVQKILHPETQAGWSSLITTILLIGGVQTFCIGMIGEYLGRSYLKLNRKPQFVIRKKTEHNEGQNE
jgi:undecaprenyl-phosphate 4-deoxy-4-formamido-L-arabinose transferase